MFLTRILFCFHVHSSVLWLSFSIFLKVSSKDLLNVFLMLVVLSQVIFWVVSAIFLFLLCTLDLSVFPSVCLSCLSSLVFVSLIYLHIHAHTHYQNSHFYFSPSVFPQCLFLLSPLLCHQAFFFIASNHLTDFHILLLLFVSVLVIYQ